MISDLLASEQHLNSVLEERCELELAIWSFIFEGNKSDDVGVFDLHGGKHAVEESIQVVPSGFLRNLRQHLKELFKVGLNQIHLVPAVEASHFGSANVKTLT